MYPESSGNHAQAALESGALAAPAPRQGGRWRKAQSTKHRRPSPSCVRCWKAQVPKNQWFSTPRAAPRRHSKPASADEYKSSLARTAGKLVRGCWCRRDGLFSVLVPLISRAHASRQERTGAQTPRIPPGRTHSKISMDPSCFWEDGGDMGASRSLGVGCLRDGQLGGVARSLLCWGDVRSSMATSFRLLLG